MPGCFVVSGGAAAQVSAESAQSVDKIYGQKTMMNTFVVYVENKPGVLTRVASLFRRRAFNIDSLTVGRTEKPDVSRMTITADADPDQARRIEANLYKLVNVLLVENVTHEASIVRDLAMIKVAAQHEARSHVLELASVFRARVVDVAPDSLTMEITGVEDKIDGLLEVLRPYGVLEMVRTGIVAMRRGKKSGAPAGATNGATRGATNGAAQLAADDDASQSV
jgi:acetolactate synthase-1/3 small subunit